MNVLEIRNLSKHYDGFSLENLSLTLPEGCVLGLVGENGAGKTLRPAQRIWSATPCGPWS